MRDVTFVSCNSFMGVAHLGVRASGEPDNESSVLAFRYPVARRPASVRDSILSPQSQNAVKPALPERPLRRPVPGWWRDRRVRAGDLAAGSEQERRRIRQG
jgi:hypothetical protein